MNHHHSSSSSSQSSSFHRQSIHHHHHHQHHHNSISSHLQPSSSSSSSSTSASAIVVVEPPSTLAATSTSTEPNLNHNRPTPPQTSSFPSPQLQTSIHRRTASLKIAAAALTRRASKRKSAGHQSTPSSNLNNPTPLPIHTLPIIQPQSYWSPQGNSRHFRISLSNPRQQVTSLLALSSIPRPVSPPVHEDSEPSTATVIAAATRAAIEEEATAAAIAASLQTHAIESATSWPDFLSPLTHYSTIPNTTTTTTTTTTPTDNILPTHPTINCQTRILNEPHLLDIQSPDSELLHHHQYHHQQQPPNFGTLISRSPTHLTSRNNSSYWGGDIHIGHHGDGLQTTHPTTTWSISGRARSQSVDVERAQVEWDNALALASSSSSSSADSSQSPSQPQPPSKLNRIQDQSRFPANHSRLSSKPRPASFPLPLTSSLCPALQPLTPIPDFSPTTTPSNSPSPSMSGPPTVSLPALQTPNPVAISPSPTPLPAEVFIFVRPPPGKNHNPLNLQVQLVLPSLPNTSTAPPPSRSASISSHHVGRSPSVRSGQSSRSNRSLASLASSEGSRGRRITPLYNLEWHTVLPTWISDAGTDAKIAKFVKKGIEISDFASIEPAEIRRGAPLFNQLSPISSNRPLSPSINAPSSVASGPAGETDSKTLAASWLKKIKKINFRKPTLPVPSDPIEPSSALEEASRFAPSDGAISSTGPSAGSGRRAAGYMWMVRRWIRPGPPEAMILVEWRKAPKPRAGASLRASSSARRSLVSPVSLSSPPLISAHRHSALVMGRTDLSDLNPAATTLTISTTDGCPLEEQPEEDSGEDSEPEDSERPWNCELVVHAAVRPGDESQSSGSTRFDEGAKRIHLGTFTPQPHHPRLVGKLAVPWNIAPVFPDDLTNSPEGDDDDDQPGRAPNTGNMLSVEDLKDLVVITSMWLIVKEELGGLTARKGAKPTTTTTTNGSFGVNKTNVGSVGVQPNNSNVVSTATTAGSSAIPPSSPAILSSVSTALERVISPISGSSSNNSNSTPNNNPRHHGLDTSSALGNFGRNRVLLGWPKSGKMTGGKEGPAT